MAAQNAVYNAFAAALALTRQTNFGNTVTANLEAGSIQSIAIAFQRAHETEMARIESALNALLAAMTTHYNSAHETEYGGLYQQQQEINGLKNRLDAMQAVVDSTQGLKQGSTPLKMEAPTTFSGSDQKSDLEGWLNQVAIFCKAYGYISDERKITIALTRLRGPAQMYMQSYFEKIKKDEDLGSWKDFTKELKTLYGRKDESLAAKEELTKLWTNKEMVKNDFIKYAERYRTLARLVDYADNIHMDKIKLVLPENMKLALIAIEINGNLPTELSPYLELLMKVYKSLNPDKSRGQIFNTGGSKEKGSSGSKDPNAMDVDALNKASSAGKKDKPKKLCKWCNENGNKGIAKTHNEDTCRKKPSSSSAPPPPNPNKKAPANYGKWHLNRMAELYKEIKDLKSEMEKEDAVEVDNLSLHSMDSLEAYIPSSVKGKGVANRLEVRREAPSESLDEVLRRLRDDQPLPRARIEEISDESSVSSVSTAGHLLDEGGKKKRARRSRKPLSLSSDSQDF